MLEQISWNDFALFLIGGTAAYYGILVFTGKLKIRNRRPIKQESPTPDQNADNPEYPDSEKSKQEKESEMEFETLELLADELQVIITQSASEGTTKEQLLESLQKEISRYQALNKPAFRGAITNLIIKTAQQELGLEVSKQEAMELWAMG